MRRVTLIATFMLATVASVMAHHGYANFDRTKSVTIDGTLEGFVYGNPHVVLKIRSGSQVYTATWDSANTVLRRANFTATTFHVGDHIVVKGAPARDASSHEIALLNEVVRPVDGWKWTSVRAPATK